MKILLAHPGQQHSFKVAESLKEEGLLFKFVTAVYDKNSSFWMRLTHHIVRGNDIGRLSNRKSLKLDDNDVVTYFTFLSLAVIVLSRYNWAKSIANWLDRKVSDFFGVKVAKLAIKNGVDVVICFSTNERTCFKYLEKKAPNIKRVVDCANSPLNYMKYIYDEDVARTGLTNLMEEVPSFWDEGVLNKEKQGISLTHYFLAPSNFVAKGLQYCGVDLSKILIQPYGCNFDIVDSPQQVPARLKFIYVGQVTFRKGLHYLLEAFSSIKDDNISLEIVGAWKSDFFVKKYRVDKRISFRGNVLHEEVHRLLLKSNVFLFASLTEGLSLSCMEALCSGLPIVCSNNSGANDVIEDGVNGFTFEYDDIDLLKTHILYFCKNKNKLPAFSKAALDTAKKFSWDHYSKQLYKNINTI